MIYLYHKFASRIVKAAEAAIPGDIWATMERVTTKSAHAGYSRPR